MKGSFHLSIWTGAKKLPNAKPFQNSTSHCVVLCCVVLCCVVLSCQSLFWFGFVVVVFFVVSFCVVFFGFSCFHGVDKGGGVLFTSVLGPC